MTCASQAIPDELASLRQAAARLQAALSESQKENSLLRQKIDSLLRRLFGSSSEKIDPAQLQLLLQLAAGEAPAANASEAKPEGKKEEQKQDKTERPRKERVQRIPDNLPVVEQVIEPAEVVAAPQDWRHIGNEVSEQIDYNPGYVFRRKVIRRKYAHVSNPDQAPVIAALPDKLQERGIAGPGMLAHVVVSKFNDHLPLYRLEQIFGQRYKINIPRQTLGRWVELAADWLQLICEKIRCQVFSTGYVQVDETPVEYLSPGNGETRQGYLWTCCKPGGDAVYRWETSRAAECLERFVPESFKGVIQCDGYSAYSAFAARRQGIELAGCWAHVRRKFKEAFDNGCRRSGWIIRQLQHLYRIESELRHNKAGPKLREAVRSHQTRPIVERIKKAMLLFKNGRMSLPKSLLGQAMEYALGQWDKLLVFLGNGRVEADNNLVENAIRPTAIGKKNWLFVGEAGAGHRAAIIYTIIECCRRRKIDAFAYLRDVFTRLPGMKTSQIAELLPANWAKAAAAKP
jgi:transposase